MKEKKIGGGANRVVFYSRAKKPKLWAALAVAVFVAAVCTVVIRLFGSEYVNEVLFFIAGALVVINVMFWVALKRQIEYNPYSYNTIIYSGFSLFLLFPSAYGRVRDA